MQRVFSFLFVFNGSKITDDLFKNKERKGMCQNKKPFLFCILFLQYNEGKFFLKGADILRRPIIPGLKEREQSNNLVTRPITSALELQERLRRERTNSYLKLFSELDTKSKIHFNIDSVMEKIEQEFADIPITEQLIGIVAKCYLEDGYDVHLLDRNQKIIRHLKKTDALPEVFDKARGLALHSQYACIEVYVDCIRAVSVNGDVSVVKE
jgi:hypothetical protein